MTTLVKRLWTLFFLAALWALTADAQETAYLRADSIKGTGATGSQGNAWLFNRNGVCYAATPRHILVDAQRQRDFSYARLVVVRPGRVSLKAQADRCAVFRDYDLALMRVSGIPDLADCGHLLVGQANVDPLLAGTAEGSLLTAGPSGVAVLSTLSIRAVPSEDIDHFWVAAAARRDRLTEGMSGGWVTIRDKPAGLLLAVKGEGAEPGMAKVLRIDRVALLLTRLFENSSFAAVDNPNCMLPITDNEPPRTSVSASGSPPDRSANLAEQRCGAVVSAWSVPPLSQDFRPDHLVGSAGALGLWRVGPSAEVTVDVKLCGKQGKGISWLRLDTSACPSGDNEDYDVEIIALSSSSAPIASLGFARVPQSSTVEISTGAPISARVLRLRFIARRQGTAAICAGPLSVN